MSESSGNNCLVTDHLQAIAFKRMWMSKIIIGTIKPSAYYKRPKMVFATPCWINRSLITGLVNLLTACLLPSHVLASQDFPLANLFSAHSTQARFNQCNILPIFCYSTLQWLKFVQGGSVKTPELNWLYLFAELFDCLLFREQQLGRFFNFLFL